MAVIALFAGVVVLLFRCVRVLAFVLLVLVLVDAAMVFALVLVGFVSVVVLFLFGLVSLVVVFTLSGFVLVVVFALILFVASRLGLVILELERCFDIGGLDDDAGDVIAQGFERALQPRLYFDAVHRDDVGLADSDQVACREFERMPFSAGRHESNDIHAVAAHTLREVLHRVDTRDHAQRLGRHFGRSGRRDDRRGRRRGSGVIRAGGDRQGHGRSDEQHVRSSEIKSHLTQPPGTFR